MAKTNYVSLQPSELAIFQAAANIYASYIASDEVAPKNDAEMEDKAIQAAISIAQSVEKLVQSDNEMS